MPIDVSKWVKWINLKADQMLAPKDVKAGAIVLGAIVENLDQRVSDLESAVIDLKAGVAIHDLKFKK